MDGKDLYLVLERSSEYTSTRVLTHAIQQPAFFQSYISHSVSFTLPGMPYTAFGRLQALPFVMAILKGKFCTPFYSLPTSGSYFGL